MIKKIIVICAAISSFQAQACDVINNTATDDVRAAIRKNGWGFNNYNVICEKLRRANAVLVTDGFATVLSNRAIAWATVGLKDRDLMIFTNEYGGSSTKTNDYASMDTAKKMLMESINDAVNNMDVDKAIQSLNESRRQAKAAYSR